jgi:hypothetical protein
MAGDTTANLVDQLLTEEEMVAVAKQLAGKAHLHLTGRAAGQSHLHRSRQEK